MPLTTAVIENFSSEELSGLSDDLKVKLQALRYLSGQRIHVTSGVRGGDSGSAHSEGVAVDISDNNTGADVASRWRFHILKAAFAVGFDRIGIYDRHIHLDTSKTKDKEVAWWSTSD